MEDLQSKTANHRLLLGITNVGVWVIVSVVGLWWFTAAPLPEIGLRELVSGLLLTALLQAAFDWLGGAVYVPPPAPGAGVFFSRWARAATVHTTLLAATATLLYWSHRLFESFCPGVAVCSLGLVLARLWILKLTAGVVLRMNPIGDTACWSVQSNDSSFTGGTCGIGRSAPLVIPECWRSNLTVDLLETVRTRRLSEIRHNLPTRAFLAVTVWNLAGCRAGTFLFDFHLFNTEHALLLHFFWMTLWGFLGLLLLPSASRGAVFFLDHAAAVEDRDVAGWIQTFPRITGEDGSSKPLVQRVFYPVPSAAERLRHLGRRPAHPLFGNVARANLYLSLATLTILGRCVHCNVGRPELWVFPPCD